MRRASCAVLALPLLGTHGVAGGAHTLFLTQAGHVYSAGSGEHGQLGHGDTQEQPVPRRIEGISGALAVAAGAFHSLVITDQGLCSFGRNQHGALGLGHTQDCGTPSYVSEWPGFEGGSFRGIACGTAHSLAITGEGGSCSLWSWGLGLSGQLGCGEHNLGDQLHPTRITTPAEDTQWAQVSCGIHHSAARTADGELYTWGDGHSGQNGHGHWFDQAEPTKVEALEDVFVKSMSCGGSHTLLSDRYGAVRSMGLNDCGQLGLGFDQTTTNLPTQIQGLHSVARVAAGWKHSLALSSDNVVHAWGHGLCGQLGVGHSNDLWDPDEAVLFLPPGASVKDLSAGWEHSAHW
eukprot:TRINITY_DN7429_c0_g1_i21.p1 TRINITY_DN7429_c0_g1~~TRINITY_DN7429_c0_g1_i21.p1  ORF type:complete len:348 (+),score=74.18 TRINITY_DN7429_c0_g1_i21:505-1548(+)